MKGCLALMREDLVFHSQGIACRARHSRARTAHTMRKPVVVMANGLAGTRASGWADRMSARIALTLGLYRPIAKAPRIPCRC